MLLTLIISVSVLTVNSLYTTHRGEIHHVEAVQKFKITGLHQGPGTILHDHLQHHADEIQISFSAYNRNWNLNLHCNHEMFHPEARFSYYDDNGLVEERMPHHSCYTTKRGAIPFANVNVLHDGSIHAMILTKKDRYVIDPMDVIGKDYKVNTKMGMYSFSDVDSLHLPIENMNVSQSRRLLQLNLGEKGVKENTVKESTDSGNPDRWKASDVPLRNVECYPGLDRKQEKKLAIGFAVSKGYYDEKGQGTPAGIEAELLNLLGDSNTIYTPQMGVHLYIKKTDIRSTSGVTGAPWNVEQGDPQAKRNGGCGVTSSQLLEQFRRWRANDPQNVRQTDVGLWHLMTDCFPPPGVIGVAYLNALCSPRVGTGLSSSGTTSTWTIVAHELGHNFGGEHSFELGQGNTGGIMDYGRRQKELMANVWQFNSRFREAEICQQLTRTMANPGTGPNGVCWSNYVAEGGTTYIWKGTGVFSACSVSCRTSEGEKPVQTELVGCYSGNTRTQLENLCPPPKPLGTGRDCDPLPPLCTTPAPTSTPASGGTQSPTSPTASSNVEACFVSIKDERKYCFRGADYNRYTIRADSNGAAVTDTAEPGFPRKIADDFKLPTKFLSNIDAIVQRNEGRIYFFKGLKYISFELIFGVSEEGERDATQDFGIPNSWGKIDAAVSTFSGAGGGYFFRNNEYCRFKFPTGLLDQGIKCEERRSITDWNRGESVPFSDGKLLAAARYWPQIGTRLPELQLAVDFIYKAGESTKVVVVKFPGIMTGAPKNMNPFGEVSGPSDIADRNICQVPGCTLCPQNQLSVCEICEEDLYDLVNGQCFAKAYLIEMVFESYQTDKKFVLATNAMAKWSSGKGNTGQAISLAPQEWIELRTEYLKKNGQFVEDFEFHFWVNLDPNADEKKDIRMIAGAARHNENYVDFSFEALACQGTTSLVVDRMCAIGQWQIKFVVHVRNAPTSTPVNSTLTHPYFIQRERWFHLIATLEKGNMKITVEGQTLQIPFWFNPDVDAVTLAGWEFTEFFIGQPPSTSTVGKNLPSKNTYLGIHGRMDQFHVDALGQQAVILSDAISHGAYSMILMPLALFLTLI